MALKALSSLSELKSRLPATAIPSRTVSRHPTASSISVPPTNKATARVLNITTSLSVLLLRLSQQLTAQLFPSPHPSSTTIAQQTQPPQPCRDRKVSSSSIVPVALARAIIDVRVLPVARDPPPLPALLKMYMPLGMDLLSRGTARSNHQSMKRRRPPSTHEQYGRLS